MKNKLKKKKKTSPADVPSECLSVFKDVCTNPPKESFPKSMVSEKHRCWSRKGSLHFRDDLDLLTAVKKKRQDR